MCGECRGNRYVSRFSKKGKECTYPEGEKLFPAAEGAAVSHSPLDDDSRLPGVHLRDVSRNSLTSPRRLGEGWGGPDPADRRLQCCLRAALSAAPGTQEAPAALGPPPTQGPPPAIPIPTALSRRTRIRKTTCYRPAKDLPGPRSLRFGSLRRSHGHFHRLLGSQNPLHPGSQPKTRK